MKIPSITQIVIAMSTRADLNDCQRADEGQREKEKRDQGNPKERDG